MIWQNATIVLTTARCETLVSIALQNVQILNGLALETRSESSHISVKLLHRFSSE